MQMIFVGTKDERATSRTVENTKRTKDNNFGVSICSKTSSTMLQRLGRGDLFLLGINQTRKGEIQGARGLQLHSVLMRVKQAKDANKISSFHRHCRHQSSQKGDWKMILFQAAVLNTNESPE
jgi:hypothetical protein